MQTVGIATKIPIDIAINKGATEAFVVDVQGPGPAKKIRMPDILSIGNVKHCGH